MPAGTGTAVARLRMGAEDIGTIGGRDTGGTGAAEATGGVEAAGRGGGPETAGRDSKVWSLEFISPNDD